MSLNMCKNYLLPCPYALIAWEELPCFGDQGQCDGWREKYKAELPQAFQLAASVREQLMVQDVYEREGIVARIIERYKADSSVGLEFLAGFNQG